MKHVTGSALLVLALAGCTALAPPQAWEAKALATPDAALAGDALERRNARHIDGNREPVHAGVWVMTAASAEGIAAHRAGPWAAALAFGRAGGLTVGTAEDLGVGVGVGAGAAGGGAPVSASRAY